MLSIPGPDIDHLMYGGRGAGGSVGEESDELKTACLMGLISILASIPEVRRIAPLHMPKLNNAVANAIMQRYVGLNDTLLLIDARKDILNAANPVSAHFDPDIYNIRMLETVGSKSVELEHHRIPYSYSIP